MIFKKITFGLYFYTFVSLYVWRDWVGLINPWQIENIPTIFTKDYQRWSHGQSLSFTHVILIR